MRPPMSFESTGLPKSDAIEKAYTRILEVHVSRFSEEVSAANRGIDAQMKEQLDMAILTGQYTPDQIEDLKKQQKQMANAFKQQVEKQMLETRDSDFIVRVVEPARVLSEGNAKNEDTINAVLLLETIRSPKDYEIIKKDFGSGVSDIIADILDFESYPSEQDAKTEALSDNAKVANLALMVGNLKSFIEIGKTLPKGQKLVLISGQDGAESKIKFASAVRGLDSKLDDMFIETFNKVSDFVEIGLKVELDSKTNTLKAIPFKSAPPKGGAGGDGPSIGGDFFGNDNDTPPSGSFGGPKNGGPKIGGGF